MQKKVGEVGERLMEKMDEGFKGVNERLERMEGRLESMQGETGRLYKSA